MRFYHTAVAGLLVICLSTQALQAEPRSDLHIEGNAVNGTLNINANGYTWDVRTDYGFLNHATQYIFSNGLYLYVQGNNFYCNNAAKQAPQTEEIETGPWQQQNIKVYRRIRIFKDTNVGRWLEIIENPTDQDMTIELYNQSNFNYGTPNYTRSNGKDEWSSEVNAYLADTQNRNNQPSVLHITCGPRSKLRPTYQENGNSLQVKYNLTVPAGQTVIIAHFLIQEHDEDKLKKLMASFRPQEYLKDLKPSVRRMIVNVRNGMLGGIDLERTGKADLVMLRSGDPIFGKVTNEQFVIHSAFGPLTLPAERVLGMAAMPNVPDVYQALLTDGQLVCGTLEETTVDLIIPAAGTQQIPLADIAQWSYQITSTKPDEMPFDGRLLILRTGDRLRFEGDSIDLKLRTRNGTVDLDPDALLAIDLDNEGHLLHRVKFLNGSVLGGILEPQTLDLTLSLNAQRSIDRNHIAKILYAEDDERPNPLTAVALANGDGLFGRLVEKELNLDGPYGPITVQPPNLLSIEAIPAQQGWVRITMWNGTVLSGKLVQDSLTFQVDPGPQIVLDPAEIVAIARPNAIPPEEVVRQVEALVARLAAESFQERDAAQKQLEDLGPSIAPLLQDHLGGKDPEVKRRLEEIIDSIGPTSNATPTMGPGGPVWGAAAGNGILLGGARLFIAQ